MRYTNRYVDRAAGRGFLRWQWQRFWKVSSLKAEAPVMGVSPQLHLIHEFDERIKLTWIGHATVLLQIGAVNILTDPHWGQRAAPFPWGGMKRIQPPGVDLVDLPQIHAVVISHNHYDHLDRATILRLMQQNDKPPIFLVPAGLESWFFRCIPKAQEYVLPCRWDDRVELLGLQFQFLAVQHWSARSPFDYCKSLWGSWAISKADFKFWFSGDLGFSKDLHDIRQQLGPVDLAAIAIGGYGPQWFMQRAHLNPDEAVKCMKILEAKAAMAIHWGTFQNLSDEPMHEPPQLLQRSLERQKLPLSCFRVFKHGQTMIWDSQQAQLLEAV